LFLLGYDSLRKRLILPFALLGLSVSAVLSSITIWLVADIDETSIKRVLLVEMESFRNRENRNPDAPAPSATLIHGDFLPSAIYPSIKPPATEAGRFRRYKIGERKYTVLVGDIGGRPYALLYDRTLSDSGLFDLAGALVGGTLLMGGLSALLGHLLAGQVVRPIRRLLTDISEKSATIELRSGAPVSFSAAHFPDNEIGQLVRALDQFALRLHGFVQRESYFAADVSHELRTPIAVIRGAAEVLVESREFSEAAHERLRTIHRQAVRMGEILEAMLLLARETGQSADPACALVEVIDDAKADCMSLVEGRPVTVTVEILDRPIVSVERSLAYVVISNLLRNAASHTREGHITIRLTETQLEVSDTGTGIPQERFSEIFKRHFKGENSSGYGLGLSIVTRIVEMIRWEISVESQSGEGTRLVVRFPSTDGKYAMSGSSNKLRLPMLSE
jgi:signal transduction histidine kinase